MQANNSIYFLCPECGGQVAEASVAARRYFCRASCRRSFEKKPNAGLKIRRYEELLWNVNRTFNTRQLFNDEGFGKEPDNYIAHVESLRLKNNISVQQRLWDLQKQLGISDLPKNITLAQSERQTIRRLPRVGPAADLERQRVKGITSCLHSAG